QAEPLLSQVVRRGAVSLGLGHPEMRRSEKNLTFLYLRRNQFEKAAAFFREQLARSTAAFGAADLRTLQPKQAPAMLRHRQGRAARGEPVLRQCLAIAERKAPDSWKAANTRSLLGECLLGQKRYAPAEPLLLKAIDGLKGHAGKPPPDDDGGMPPPLVT